jgi:hypothetical protein
VLIWVGVKKYRNDKNKELETAVLKSELKMSAGSLPL